MSLPSFPEKDNTPSREEVINQIISSIAMEELGLSHIINAEGEKLQYALGTLSGASGPEKPLTMDELLELNKSIHKTLDGTMMNQLLLKEKLLRALNAGVMYGPTGPTGPQGPATIEVDPEVVPLGPDESPTVENVGASDQEVVLKFGIPRGVTGATGPAGETGATPTVAAGTTETIDPGLDAEVISRETETGIELDFKIPRGVPGDSIRMLGSYTTFDLFEHDHPTGDPGDMWLVSGYLESWSPTLDGWINLGYMIGPVGQRGPQGERGDTPEIGQNGNWFIGGEDTGVPAEGKRGEPGPETAIIPFAIKNGTLLSTDEQGEPSLIAFSGFGTMYNSQVYLQEGEWSTGIFTVGEDMSYGSAFVMPRDSTLKKLYALVSIEEYNRTFEDGAIIQPFVCLAISNADELVFTILQETITNTQPFAGGVEYPMHSIAKGSSVNLDVEIAEGTLVAIIAGLCAENITNSLHVTLAVSGGLYLES